VRENIFDFEPLGENEMVRMTHDDWLSLDRSSDSFWLQPHNSKSGSSSSRSGSESSSSVRSNSTHTQEGPPRNVRESNVRENIFDFEPLGENEMVRMTHDDWLSLDRSSDSFWLQPHNDSSSNRSWGSDHLLPSEDRIFYENIFDDAVNEIQSLQKRSDLGDFMVPETRRKIKSDDEYSEWSNFENEYEYSEWSNFENEIMFLEPRRKIKSDDEYSEWSNFEGEFMFQEPPRKIKSDDELLIGRNDVSRNKSGIEDIKYDESFLKDGEPFRRNDELLFDSPRSNESQKKKIRRSNKKKKKDRRRLRANQYAPMPRDAISNMNRYINGSSSGKRLRVRS